MSDILDILQPALEDYEIESHVGQDELTLIFKAKRKSDRLPVLIRVVAPQFTFDTYFIRRFSDAAKRNMKLEHPNILKIFEVGQVESHPYFISEWTTGLSLDNYLAANGPISVNEMVNLCKQLASVLDYAHTKAIIHGDLNGASVFIDDGIIKVADFGLSHAMSGTSLAKKGFAIGHPLYLSPERVKGESPSRTADLYAFGVISYLMLTGEPPFKGEATAILHQQIYEQPLAPHNLKRNIRPAVSEAVLRMLSKGLELRHNTGAEFARALQMAAEGSSPIKRVTEDTVTVRQVKEKNTAWSWNRFAFIAFIVTPLLGLALALGFWGVSNWFSNSQLNPQQANLPPTAVFTPIPTFSLNETEAIPTPTFLAQAEAVTPTPDEAAPIALITPDAPPTEAPGTGGSQQIFAPPAPPAISDNSPFSALKLAGAITDNYQPEAITNTFDTTTDPIYLFFDYDNMEIGQSWSQIWRWDDIVLERSDNIWPAEYGASGTAWVFYSPSLGFNPGPYSVVLEVEGQVVASANFVVQETE